jgi:protein DGCR14
MNEGQRRLVLTEEDYTSKLSLIVSRDYFPDVSKLERQNALLNRRLEGDVPGAIAVRRASRRLIEHEEAVAARREEDDYDVVGLSEANDTTFNKTTSVVRSVSVIGSQTYSGRPIRKRPRPLEEETLTGFVARATNEDDHEFDSNLKRDVKENRQRICEFYGLDNKNSSSDAKSPESSIHNLHLEMASDDFAPESNRIKWNKPEMRNSLFFNPTPINNIPSRKNHGAIEHEKELLKGSSASSASTEERSLMPPPSKQQTSGILSIYNREMKNTIHLSKSELVEYIPKHNLEKKIQPSATRFPSKESFMSNIGSHGNGIITNQETDSCSDTDYMSSTTGASTDLDVPLRPVEEERRRFQRKQKSDRRSYVAMTPQIIPGAGNESPITTWGSIDSTPMVLSGRDESIEQPPSSSPFRISDKSERECAASKAELLLARRAKRASSSSSSMSSSSSKIKKRRASLEAKRPGSLTPAALSLLEKAKSTQPRSGGAFVSALRTSYTPRLHPSSSSSSLKHSRRTSKTGRRDHAFNTTPQI